MHLATASTRNTSAQRKPAKRVPVASRNQYAVDEIGAYIALRDSLLTEAQQGLTEGALQRLVLANNFVANCLRPGKAPYLSQSLPEADAARELKRCAAVDAAITKLRARLMAAA
jgi:hypothetical protein